MTDSEITVEASKLRLQWGVRANRIELSVYRLDDKSDTGQVWIASGNGHGPAEAKSNLIQWAAFRCQRPVELLAIAKKIHDDRS